MSTLENPKKQLAGLEDLPVTPPLPDKEGLAERVEQAREKIKTNYAALIGKEPNPDGLRYSQDYNDKALLLFRLETVRNILLQYGLLSKEALEKMSAIYRTSALENYSGAGGSNYGLRMMRSAIESRANNRPNVMFGIYYPDLKIQPDKRLKDLEEIPQEAYEIEDKAMDLSTPFIEGYITYEEFIEAIRHEAENQAGKRSGKKSKQEAESTSPLDALKAKVKEQKLQMIMAIADSITPDDISTAKPIIEGSMSSMEHLKIKDGSDMYNLLGLKWLLINVINKGRRENKNRKEAITQFVSNLIDQGNEYYILQYSLKGVLNNGKDPKQVEQEEFLRAAELAEIKV